LGLISAPLPPYQPDSGRYYTVAGQVDSSHQLLDLGKKGVYPSYNPTPEDIAPAAAFITSEEAGWITGQILSVNGGVS